MSWRVLFIDGSRPNKSLLRTRTDAVLFACDLDRVAVFVNAVHSTGQSISKLELETWRRANDAMLKGRVSPRSLGTGADAVDEQFKNSRADRNRVYDEPKIRTQ